MIQTRRAQRTFGDGLIAEEVKDLHEEWMKHADQVLGDKEASYTVPFACKTWCGLNSPVK
jgi:hypothetical protein